MGGQKKDTWPKLWTGTVVILDTKSRTVGFDMFTHGSIVQLTNGQSTVFQGHVVFKSEALAQTFFTKWMRVKKNKTKKLKSHTGKCIDKPQNYLWNDKKLPVCTEPFQQWVTFSEPDKIQWCRFHWRLWLSPSCCPRTSLSSVWIRGHRCFLRWRSTCPRAAKTASPHVKSNSTKKKKEKIYI